ncbi:TULIP family P47-like protein [Paenibacillus thiaminolyticus]|uniref:TULIP family P47-like protein n=1 Tax=Paenibacillus thiaminolyticus TaxID=49283 RepID=UPI0035A71B13
MNTYGWDIIYVNSNESINKQLKKYMNENKITFIYEDENTFVSLTFDNWEVVPGGSSKLLRLKTLVKEGELTFMGQRTLLNGICPLLEVQLGFFDDKNDSYIQKLMFNFQVKGEKEGDQREGAITVINPDVNKIFAEGSMIYTLLNLTLADMFIANKEQISHIFAQLNISPDFPWMQPKKYKYSYYSPTSSKDKGFLSVLSVVTNRDISGLTEGIDGSILDNNHDSFLVLSERLFLEHIIMPELPNSFGNGTTKNHFKFEGTSNTSGVIKNNKDINCASVRVGAIDYYPIYEKLNIKIEGNKLQMKASGKCDVTGLANTYVKFDVEANFSFYYDRNNKKIQFKQDSPPKVTTEKVIPWWVWILGAVTIGIIFGITSAIESSVARDLKVETNAYISELKADVVRWSGMDNSEVADCVLDVALCIKGIKLNNGNSNNYKIVSALNDSSVVDMSLQKNGDVHLWEYGGALNQKWNVINDETKKAYQFKNMYDESLVLAWNDYMGSRNVFATPNKGKDEHYWLLEDTGDGYHILKNKKYPYFVLDVDKADTDNGTNIKVNEQHDFSSPYIKAQKFKLIQV